MITKFSKLRLLILGCLIALSECAFAKNIDPFSKIIITSTKALGKKDLIAGSFSFQYQDNVRVTFADSSTVTASTLEVVMDEKEYSKSTTQSFVQKDKKEAKSSQDPIRNSKDAIKQIIFTGNVCITNGYRKAYAKKACYYPLLKKCVLEDSVSITQRKHGNHDVPVNIQSNKAEFDLKTGQISFTGSSQKPVSSTIVLADHPLLDKQKKNAGSEGHGKNPHSSSVRSA